MAGIALRLHEAISQRDYTLVQGIVIVTSLLIVSLNLFVDILIALISSYRVLVFYNFFQYLSKWKIEDHFLFDFNYFETFLF